MENISKSEAALEATMARDCRAEAARRAWETIRARRAAGFYAQPREARPGPVARMAANARQEVSERFLIRRTDCRWQNARFQGAV
jgi:hypothetical protein